jgi:creatinine amidohydrolase
MTHTARPFIVEEATYKQLRDFKPNVAVQPWGATEAHNYHLPHGTDNYEAVALGTAAVTQAVARGAKVCLLPNLPYGNDNMQLDQTATITMRSSTQQLVLKDICDSLVKQGIDRLVILNFHGGNEFKQMIRDIMFDCPIFIVQVHGYQTADYKPFLDDKGGDHANEFETALMLHIAPNLVDMASAGDGAETPFKLKTLRAPGVWCPRDWRALTPDTGTGKPHKATAEKGKKVLDALVAPLVDVLVELSAGNNGDFPYIVRKK